MTIQTLRRCGIVLGPAALASGCSMVGLGDRHYGATPVTNECRWNRSGCLYDGKYEAGEKEYAEEEAARLNRQQLERLRGR